MAGAALVPWTAAEQVHSPMSAKLTTAMRREPEISTRTLSPLSMLGSDTWDNTGQREHLI